MCINPPVALAVGVKVDWRQAVGTWAMSEVAAGIWVVRSWQQKKKAA